MPYPAARKAETRARILEAARRLFNRQGFEAVSIDDIMAEAGLTRGGFYYHFANKEELFAESLAHYAAANCPEHWLGESHGLAEPERSLAAMMVRGYLSEAHLEQLDAHCPMIALPSDVARAGDGVRAVYERMVVGMIDTFRASMAADDPAREQKALSMASLCIGAMVVARTLQDPDLRRQVREAACAAALAQADLTDAPAPPVPWSDVAA